MHWGEVGVVLVPYSSRQAALVHEKDEPAVTI